MPTGSRALAAISSWKIAASANRPPKPHNSDAGDGRDDEGGEFRHALTVNRIEALVKVDNARYVGGVGAVAQLGER